MTLIMRMIRERKNVICQEPSAVSTVRIIDGAYHRAKVPALRAIEIEGKKRNQEDPRIEGVSREGDQHHLWPPLMLTAHPVIRRT